MRRTGCYDAIVHMHQTAIQIGVGWGVLMYFLSRLSICLGRNLPLMINWAEPSMDPSVPNSARKNPITCSAVRFMLHPNCCQWQAHIERGITCTLQGVEEWERNRATGIHLLQISLKLQIATLFVPILMTFGAGMLNFLPPMSSGLFSVRQT